MSSTQEIISRLQSRIAKAPSTDLQCVPPIVPGPTLSDETLDLAEAELGFRFPPLLRDLYRQVADGGFGNMTAETIVGVDMLTGEELTAAERTRRTVIIVGSAFSGGYGFHKAFKSLADDAARAADNVPQPRSFVDDMTPDEAARYENYWSQGHVDTPNNTRPREYTTPGTRSITDQKLSETGDLYSRQTIYDDYDRRIGTNDFTDHGRPKDHPNPHHHPNSALDTAQHGPVIPGLHPLTPDGDP